jgi:hypothetical protein
VSKITPAVLTRILWRKFGLAATRMTVETHLVGFQVFLMCFLCLLLYSVWFICIAVVPENVENTPSVADLYEDISLQQVHSYIIENKLSVEQGDALLALWTKVIVLALFFYV